MTGSASTPNFVSIWANLSLAEWMPALVKADSTLRIQISTFCLSKVGRSTFLGTRRKSVGWTVVSGRVGAVVGWEAWKSLTASRDWVTDSAVAALTVASTNAFICEASILSVVSKKTLSGAVGEGVGVLWALFLIRVCGEGYLYPVGS